MNGKIRVCQSTWLCTHRFRVEVKRCSSNSVVKDDTKAFLKHCVLRYHHDRRLLVSYNIKPITRIKTISVQKHFRNRTDQIDRETIYDR